YCGAKQIAGEWTRRTFVTSGGGSAATGLGCTPRSPAVPVSVKPRRNLRRLHTLACRIGMGIFLPDAGQCDPENASQISDSFAQDPCSALEGRCDGDVICLRRQSVNTSHFAMQSD